MSKNIHFCGNNPFKSSIDYKIVAVNLGRMPNFWLESAEKIGNLKDWQNSCINNRQDNKCNCNNGGGQIN